MNKKYELFYEKGQNRYYTLIADGETYLATESVIPVARMFRFLKPKNMTQGLKLLKFSTPIAFLMRELTEIKKEKGQRGVSEDMIRYTKIDNDKLKNDIYKCYENVIKEQRDELYRWFDERCKEIKSSLKESNEFTKEEYEKRTAIYKDRLDRSLKIVDDRHPLNKDFSLDTPKHTGSKIIKAMLGSGLEHLYTERVTAFADNVYLYEQDCFGTLTIYRVFTVKNVVKTIDTFIYDKKLVEALFASEYEKDLNN